MIDKKVNKPRINDVFRFRFGEGTKPETSKNNLQTNKEPAKLEVNKHRTYLSKVFH